MSVAANDLADVVTTANHLLPVVITLAAIVVFFLVKTYLPQMHYIDLVTKATDQKGLNNLAKYMAKRNGGKHIDTNEMWESFLPAAQAVSDKYHKDNWNKN